MWSSKNFLVYMPVIIVSTFLSQGCRTTATSQPKIRGGDPVVAGHPAWQNAVQLVKKTEQGYRKFCSGALINRKTVVTAAHCFHPQKNSAPTHVRFPLPGGGVEIIAIRKATNHEAFTATPYFDVNVVTLASEAPESYQSRKFLNAEVEVTPNHRLEVAGFGDDSTSLDASASTLTAASAKILKIVNNYWTRGVFALQFEEGVAAIPGDSGGPVYIKYQDQWYLLGLSSGQGSGWPLPSMTLGGSRLRGPYLPAYAGWVAANSDFAAQAPGADRVEWGLRPKNQTDRNIKELCESESLNKVAFSYFRAFLLRLKTFDCQTLANSLHLISSLVIREGAQPYILAQLPKIENVTLKTSVNLSDFVDISLLKELTYADQLPNPDDLLHMQELEYLTVDVAAGSVVSRPPFTQEDLWLAGKDQLKFVVIRNLPMAYTEKILQHPSILSVECSGCDLKSIPKMRQNKTYWLIDFSRNEIDSVTPLKDVSAEIISLDNNKITDLSPLDPHATIQELSVTGNPLPVQNCPLVTDKCQF